jgi:hypothetical protein
MALCTAETTGIGTDLGQVVEVDPSDAFRDVQTFAGQLDILHLRFPS